MLSNVFKNSIAAGLLLASSTLYAATISFSEEFAGMFFVGDDTISYNLTSGDGSLPSINSTIDLVARTGTFLRDAGDGNTFFGTLDFVLGDLTPLDDGIFNYQVEYSGNLLITGGTGIFDGATGGGTFTGTDLYFALFEAAAEENDKAVARFAAVILPAGTASQDVNWRVTTGDVNAVPVPAAAWLFGSGILGWAGARRKSKTTTS